MPCGNVCPATTHPVASPPHTTNVQQKRTTRSRTGKNPVAEFVRIRICPKSHDFGYGWLPSFCSAVYLTADIIEVARRFVKLSVGRVLPVASAARDASFSGSESDPALTPFWPGTSGQPRPRPEDYRPRSQYCSARQLRAIWRAGAVRPLIGPRQGIGPLPARLAGTHV